MKKSKKDTVSTYAGMVGGLMLIIATSGLAYLPAWVSGVSGLVSAMAYFVGHYFTGKTNDGGLVELDKYKP